MTVTDPSEPFGEYDPDEPCPRCFMPVHNWWESPSDLELLRRASSLVDDWRAGRPQKGFTPTETGWTENSIVLEPPPGLEAAVDSARAQGLIPRPPERMSDERVPMNVHPFVRQRLRDLLMSRPELRGYGYSAFLGAAMDAFEQGNWTTAASGDSPSGETQKGPSVTDDSHMAEKYREWHLAQAVALEADARRLMEKAEWLRARAEES